ncbi:MAG TPA: NUDIX domain-containing protein [Candidatus Paceibacterota bacterium]
MKIPVVNEQDEIIGSEERSVVHRDGLKHREVGVWLVTSDDEIVFQKRALFKEIYPGLLDCTAGGHVDSSSESYETAATRELVEETGQRNLKLFMFDKKYGEEFDPVTNISNNRFSTVFVARLNTPVEELVVEDGKVTSFKAFSINSLKNLDDTQKEQFIPRFITDESINDFQKMIDFLHTNKS